MSRGQRAAYYFLMKLGKENNKSPTDYYIKESQGTVYDPSGLLKEFGINNGDIIKDTDFEALCAGINPRTGEPLLKNFGEAHRAGTDFAFSPPKWFSTLWAVSTPATRAELEAIFQHVDNNLLNILSTHSTTRIGAGGKDSVKTAFASVTFTHLANRLGQPQLHNHNTVLNLTGSGRKLRTLEPRSMIQWQTSSDALAIADLLWLTKNRFPGIKYEKSKTNTHTCDITGIPESLINAWSKRREEILAVAEEQGIDIDDVGGMERLFYITRTAKESTSNDPHIEWRQFAEVEHQFGSFQAEALLNAPAIVKQPLAQADIDTRLGNVLTQLTQTESAVKENALLRAVAEEFFGDMDSKQILDTFEKLKTGQIRINNQDQVIRLGGFDGMDYYSTVSMQTVEQRLSELSEKLANDGKHAINIVHTEKAIADQTMLSDEQVDVVRHAVSSGSIKVVEGAAGSGKSTSALAIANAFKAAGYTLRGLASSWSAASVIGRDAEIDSRAAAGFINAVQKGKIHLTKDDVLMIDEVGLLGSRDSEILLSYAEKYGCKIILLGEEKQLSAVSAGPALSIIMEKTGVASIETIRRQRTQIQREIVAAFRVGDTDVALEKLESQDGLQFHSNKKTTLNAMVQDWADFTHNNPKKSTLLLAVKNSDVRQINSQVRGILRKRGVISGPDIALDTPAPNASTKSAKFAMGEHVIFKKNDNNLDVKNNDKASITDIRPSANGGYDITLKHADGREIQLNTLKYKDQETGGVPLSHSYTGTQWSSQGTTVDKSFVLASGMDRRYAYVGMSRHRDSATLYVDESEIKSKLKAADKPSDRDAVMIQLATQLARKSDKLSTLDFIDNRIGQRVAIKNRESAELVARMKLALKDNPLGNVAGALERIKKEAEAIEQAAKRAAEQQRVSQENTLRM